MDGVRIGRILRALRMRRGWRQLDLAERVGVSQSLIARVERGGAGRLRLDSLERIAKALEARLSVRLDWRGEAADRLLDAGHAELVEFLLGLLREAGWAGIPEVTFSVGPERGSFDILAWHEPTGTLLIVEVKTVVPDMQAMLATFDRKQRHANGVARGRGWRPARIWSLLAIGESRTSRRRVEAHSATFAARFPDGAVAAKRSLRAPAAVPAGAAALRALWFLTGRTRATPRQRVVTPRRTG